MDSQYLSLTEYPATIATRQYEQLGLEQEIRALQLNLDQKTAEIEEMIAFDKSLTNDAKRKALRVQLMAEPPYKELLESLQSLQDEKTRSRIEIDMLSGQFTVLQIEARL
jgi:hypothetical protein